MLPFLGDSASQFKDGERLAQRRMQTLGPVYESWMFGERLISIARPDLVKWCLNNGEPEVMHCAPFCTLLCLRMRHAPGLPLHAHALHSAPRLLQRYHS